MSAEDRRSRPRSKAEAAARARNLWIVLAALAVLVAALGFVAGRDGFARVLPDLWDSAKTLARWAGASS